MASPTLAMRRCWVCGEELELHQGNFYRNKSKADGWGTECKECHKRLSQERRSTARQKFVADNGSKCAGCGLHHANYMFFDLDHITPLRDVKKPRGVRSYNHDEIQVLCPNCHRLKTMTDMGWGKYE